MKDGGRRMKYEPNTMQKGKNLRKRIYIILFNPGNKKHFTNNMENYHSYKGTTSKIYIHKDLNPLPRTDLEFKEDEFKKMRNLKVVG